MKLLMHICCAPCSVMSVKTYQDQGHDITGYWYNPNIHPFKEYEERLQSAKAYFEMIRVPLLVNDYYGLELFTKNVISDLSKRCDFCYEERLRNAAKLAKSQGFEGFTTSLLISPYQKHDLLRTTCETIALEEGIPFVYIDLRPFYREGQAIAKTLPIYMQKYCGCVFSEEERYLKRKRKEQMEENQNE